MYYIWCWCAEQALTAVLKINFKKIGSTADKIERGEFVIQDTATKRDIDLSSDWEVCFFPGQRVDMSMIFTKTDTVVGKCPKCGNACDVTQEDIEWYFLTPLFHVL